MKTIDQIASYGTLTLVTDNKLSDIVRHEIYIGPTQLFTATTSSIYYSLESDAVIPGINPPNSVVSGRAVFKIRNLSSQTCYKFSATVYTDPGIEFWSNDFQAAALDTALQGGTWSNGIISDAFGVNPADLIIDGDAFMSPSISYAPEEMVPGHCVDSLGINVYTKGADSYASVVSGAFYTVAGNTTTVTLSVFPDAYSGIRVYVNNRTLDYASNYTSLSTNQFFIDGRYLIIPPQAQSGQGGYTFVRIGGTGLIDSNATDIANTNTGIISSLASYRDIRFVYVLVNGNPITNTFSSSTIYYQLLPDYTNNLRAAVYVYNLTLPLNTVQAWFFNTPNVKFNTFREEIFSAPATNNTQTLVLSYPPYSWQPYSDKAIVEISNSSASTTRRRLIPPYTSNYYKTNNNLTYDIDNRSDNRPLTYLSTITAADVLVYGNGTRLRPGFDFNFDLVNKKITLTNGVFPDGVYISVVALGGNDYDYVISDNILRFRNTINNTNVKVTTFPNHDQLFINNEVFPANGLRLYQLEYPAEDENYVWVYVDGYPIVHRVDFEVLADKKTVQLALSVNQTNSSTVMVTSIRNPQYLNNVFGYRIFKDFFERDQYKRLSKDATTFLRENLKFYDTTIKVFDTGILSPSNPTLNVPGVVLIDRERIEFFNVDYDELQTIRRGTLGTSPAFYVDEGAKVIDQGILQTVPYVDNIYTYNTLTTTATVYTIPYTYVENTFTNLIQGINLTTSTAVDPIDQIKVYYGGKQLNKSSYLQYIETTNETIEIPAEFSVAILSTTFNFTTATSGITISVKELLYNENMKLTLVYNDNTGPTIYNSSVVITNSVSENTGTIGVGGPSYSVVYKFELDYIGTLFTITNMIGTVNTVSIYLNYQHLTLNINDRLEPEVALYMMKREGKTWNGNQSLLLSSDIQSRFIRTEPAELPDVYYYGGDPRLQDTNNVPLTDDNGDVLTRY